MCNSSARPGFAAALFIGLVLGSTAAAQQQQSLPIVTFGTWELDDLPGGSLASQNDDSRFPTYIQSGYEDEYEPIYWRNYYVLDLTSLSPSDPITSFTMQLPNALVSPGVNSPGTYYLWSTASTLSTLQGSGTDASIAESLEGGTLFGQTSSQSSSGGFWNITVTGDGAFLSFLNANLGSDVLFAGSQGLYTPLGPNGYFDSDPPTFTISAVPEPSASALLLPAIAAGTLLFPRMRKRRARP